MKKMMIAAMVFVLVCAGGAMAAPAGPGKLAMGPGPVVNRHEMTPEVRAKADEMFKLHEELRAEMQKDTPDKAKARDIHDKIVALRGELSKARFEEVLKNPKMIQQPARPGRGSRGPEMTAAEKAKFDEMRGLHKNIREELSKELPNKAKIRDWAKQAQKLKNDMDDLRLEEMLKDPAKFKNAPMFGPGPQGPGPKGFRGGPGAMQGPGANGFRGCPCNCWTQTQQ